MKLICWLFDHHWKRGAWKLAKADKFYWRRTVVCSRCAAYRIQRRPMP